MKLYDIAEPILKNLEVSPTLSLYINLVVNLIILGIIAYLLDYIFFTFSGILCYLIISAKRLA